VLDRRTDGQTRRLSPSCALAQLSATEISDMRLSITLKQRSERLDVSHQCCMNDGKLDAEEFMRFDNYDLINRADALIT